MQNLKFYQEAFQDIPQVSLFKEPEGSLSNYWLQTLLLDESVSNQRDAILDTTNSAGLMTRPIWNLLHNLAPYRYFPSAPIPVAESLERRIVNLPSSKGLV